MNKSKLYFAALLFSTSAMGSSPNDFNNDNSNLCSRISATAEESDREVDPNQLHQTMAVIKEQAQKARWDFEKYNTLSDQLAGLLAIQMNLENSIPRYRATIDWANQDLIRLTNLPLDKRNDNYEKQIDSSNKMLKLNQSLLNTFEERLSQNKSIIEMIVKIFEEDPPELPPAALKLLTETKEKLATMRSSLANEFKDTRDKNTHWYREAVRINNLAAVRLKNLSDRYVMLNQELEKLQRKELELQSQTPTANAYPRYAH